ncbi:MAG: penicillin-binding transpeptidase domain-containing protein, partial [Phycisphaerae bacterium]
YDIIRRFGFGQPTRIGFPGEGAGVVHSLGHWTTYSTTSVSFGYEVGVTPLQLAAAFSAIVNDGVLVRPVLVARLLDAAGRTIRSLDTPEIVRRVVSSDVARYMSHEVLPAVVERGSGSRARLKGYSVLGKTGTAKVPYRNRSGYEPGAYVATFIGAAPVEDPRVVVLAMIRRPNPSLGYYGGTVAAPVVREILRAALPYLGVASRELIAARIDDQRVGEH